MNNHELKRKFAQEIFDLYGATVELRHVGTFTRQAVMDSPELQRRLLVFFARDDVDAPRGE